MIGQMMNYNVCNRTEKDKLAQKFIEQVNPYEKKPSLGIDLRALSRYAGDQNTRIIDMNKADIARFKLK